MGNIEHDAESFEAGALAALEYITDEREDLEDLTMRVAEKIGVVVLSLPDHSRGAVDENQKLRDRVADLETALEHYAATSATDPWVARDALTTTGGQ